MNCFVFSASFSRSVEGKAGKAGQTQPAHSSGWREVMVSGSPVLPLLDMNQDYSVSEQRLAWLTKFVLPCLELCFYLVFMFSLTWGFFSDTQSNYWIIRCSFFGPLQKSRDLPDSLWTVGLCMTSKCKTVCLSLLSSLRNNWEDNKQFLIDFVAGQYHMVFPQHVYQNEYKIFPFHKPLKKPCMQ